MAEQLLGWQPDYATVDDLAAMVRINDAVDDVQLALAISTASRMIDGPNGAGRQFGLCAVAEARIYTAVWDRDSYRWLIEIDDLMDTTGLALAVDLYGRGDYGEDVDPVYTGFRPPNAAQKSRPYTRLALLPTSPVQMTSITDAVRVTARWGWTVVPDTIKQATLIQASRLLARRDAPFGVAGSPEAGSEMRLLARLDPDVQVAISPYRRWWGAV